MSEIKYLHGYSDWEQDRLLSQNNILAKYIYDRINLEGQKNILEIGCGVGAQMIHMLHNYPHIHITGIELEARQLEKAKINLANAGISDERYDLIQANATHLEGLIHENFDAIILVWVLEHIPEPIRVLQELKKILKPGAHIWITEVYHQSFATYPVKNHLMAFWNKMIQIQSRSGADANVGLRLGQLLYEAGFKTEWVKPYPMFFDSNHAVQRLEMLEYWHDLIFSSIESMEVYDPHIWKEWEDVKNELKELVAHDQAIFYYSFIQAYVIV